MEVVNDLTQRARTLQSIIDTMNLSTAAIGKPTHWPIDSKKIPDLLDFVITRGISKNFCSIESCLDLSSNYSSVIITLNSKVITRNKPYTLHNAKTDFYFQELLTISLNNSISLKTDDDIIYAMKSLNHAIQRHLERNTDMQKSKNQFRMLIRNKSQTRRKMKTP